MRRLFSFFMCFILLVSSIFATAIQGFCAEGENFSLYSSDGGNALCEASVKGILRKIAADIHKVFITILMLPMVQPCFRHSMRLNQAEHIHLIPILPSRRG